MARTTHTIDAPQASVFAVLLTPETYPFWLVGCQDIRAVDEGWPAAGTAFHHRVGLMGPLTVADSTEVIEVEAPHRLVLEVRARPFGRGRATFTVVPDGEGRTRITIDEVPIGPLAVARPLVDPVTDRRNAHSLAQLADLVVADGRLHERATAG